MVLFYVKVGLCEASSFLSDKSMHSRWVIPIILEICSWPSAAILSELNTFY